MLEIIKKEDRICLKLLLRIIFEVKSNHLNIELIMCKKKKIAKHSYLHTSFYRSFYYFRQIYCVGWTVSWEFVGPIICTSSKAVRRVSDLVYSTANQGNTVHFSGLGAP